MVVQVLQSEIFGKIEFPVAGPTVVEFNRIRLRQAAKDRVILRKMAEPYRVFGYDTITITDDATIRKMLKKTAPTDLIVALIGADEETRAAIYRNLSKKGVENLQAILKNIETGNALGLLVERSRNMISETFVELLRE